MTEICRLFLHFKIQVLSVNGLILVRSLRQFHDLFVECVYRLLPCLVCMRGRVVLAYYRSHAGGTAMMPTNQIVVYGNKSVTYFEF